MLNTSGKVVANYWLNEVFSPEAGQAHRHGDIHIHDLDMLAGYCAGWSLRQLLEQGFGGRARRDLLRATETPLLCPGADGELPGHLTKRMGGCAGFFLL